MIDIEHEIYTLKSDLVFSGVSDSEAINISNQARSEINETISYIVDESLAAAKMAGMELSADDFIKELRVVNYGMQFQIDTISGKTDFSVPPFAMLPGLLRGGKIAKDGSTYRVIPVKQKSQSKSTVDVMRSINSNRTEARDKKRSAAGPVNFRVASSKQDPNSQWRHPGFDRDMTATLKQINEEMNDRVDNSVRDILNSYRGF